MFRYIVFVVILLQFKNSGLAQFSNPNVVFIAIDDLNDWIGVLNGHPQVLTPNMDRLAKSGTLFANAHTQSPLCNPSRTSVLTSIRPSNSGIYGLAPRYRDTEKTKNVVSLPQYFANAGYKTISTGKILHGGITEGERKTEFQEWGPDGNFGPVPKEKIVKTRLDMVDHPLLDWGVFPLGNQDSLLSDYKTATWAVNKIDELAKQQDQPFFLAVGFHRPHVPLLVTQRWFDLYPLEKVILPPAPPQDRNDIPDFAWYLHWFLPEPRLSWLEANNQWRHKVRAYLASVSFVDAQVGRVLDAIEAGNLSDNTVIVLWSDHGYHLGEKNITGKNTLWERSTHVPLIFSGPGVPANQVCGEAVELLDIYPSLLDLAGLTPNEQVEGISLLSLIQNPNSRRDRPAITTHNPGNHSVKTEEWRYIRYGNGEEELYNVVVDPNEWYNLAHDSEYFSIIHRLKKYLPETSEVLAPGSKHRVLEKRGLDWYWENKRIIFNELIR